MIILFSFSKMKIVQHRITRWV